MRILTITAIVALSLSATSCKRNLYYANGEDARVVTKKTVTKETVEKFTAPKTPAEALTALEQTRVRGINNYYQDKAQFALPANNSALNVSFDPKKEYEGYYKVGAPYTIKGKQYTPETDLSYEETGMASWYGPNFVGKKTANGEIFNPQDISAAHRTLPLPSIVRVENLETGKAILVRVNDRGPYAKDRIIDLSERAAELVGMKDDGTHKVKVTYVHDATVAMLRHPSHANYKNPYANQIVEGVPNTPQVAARLQQVAARAANPTQLKAVTLPTATIPQVKVPVGQVIKPLGATVAPVTPPLPSGYELYPVDKFRNKQYVGSQNEILKVNSLPTANLPQGVNPTSKYIQAGSFTDYGKAKGITDALFAKYPNVYVDRVYVNNTQLYRVKIGPYSDVNKLAADFERIKQDGITNAIATSK